MSVLLPTKRENNQYLRIPVVVPAVANIMNLQEPNSRGDDDAVSRVQARGGIDGDTRVAAAGGLGPAPPLQRRRSLRQIVEPDRFVARPSLQGLTNADGDAIYLAGGILVGGMAATASDSSMDAAYTKGMEVEDYEKYERSIRLAICVPVHHSSSSLSIVDSGYRSQDPQVEIRPIAIAFASEITTTAEESFDPRCFNTTSKEEIESPPDSIAPQALEKSDTSVSMYPEGSHLPQCGFRYSENLLSSTSNPPTDHASKSSITQSIEVNAEPRYPKRKRHNKSLQVEWELGTDRDDDIDEDDGDNNDSLASAAVEVRKDSNPTIGSSTDKDLRNSKRDTRSSANEIELVLKQYDAPSTPRAPLRCDRAETPNSRGSNKAVDTTHDSMLNFSVGSPPSSTKSSTCRATACKKYTQNNCNGFCRTHHNQYLICTGQSATWT